MGCDSQSPGDEQEARGGRSSETSMSPHHKHSTNGLGRRVDL
jgi:hypothetical protein